MTTKLHRLFMASLMMLTGLHLSAQTITWDGGAGTDQWTDATNWDTNALPSAANDVDLNGATVVLSANATVQRVLVDGSGSLTVNTGITLTISGFAGGDDGLEVQSSATFTNNGTIDISNIDIASTDADALYNRGLFTNDGIITIDGSGQHGIYLQGGTFTNNAGASISVTNYGQNDSGGDGIYVDDTSGTPSTLNNVGTITVAMTSADDGIYINDGSIINNTGTITVGGASGDNGLRVDDSGAFNNNLGGILTINATPDDQLFLDNTGVFGNSGTVNLNDAQDVGLYVTDDGVFTNNAGGVVNLNNASNFAIQIDRNTLSEGFTLAEIVNNGTISVDGGSNDGVKLQEQGVFTNNAGGVLNITNAGDEGIQIDDDMPASTFNNSGLIIITTSTDHALENFGTFNNLTGGIYEARDSGNDGIRMRNTAIFNNDGAIQISGFGNDGIETEDQVFTNTANATYTIGPASGGIGELEVRDNLDFGTATITFDIAGTTSPTDFDQLENFSAGTAVTITNATLNLDWGSYVPSIGDTFRIMDGSGDITGTFSAVTTTNSDIVTTISYDATEVEVEVTDVLSTDNLDFNNQVKIYPNPAKDVLNIDTNNQEITSVAIYNILGSRVLALNEVTNNTINVSNLKNGVYLVRIEALNNTITKKVVIDK